MRERLTFEMAPEIKSELVRWAREEDRSIGSLLRRIVEKSIYERLTRETPEGVISRGKKSPCTTVVG